MIAWSIFLLDKNISPKNIPDTESLKDTYERVFPYFEKNILSKLAEEKNIVISAHGNSIRAICKYLFKLNEKEIPNLLMYGFLDTFNGIVESPKRFDKCIL